MLASPTAGPAQDKLSARLAGLALPGRDGAPAPGDWGPWTGGPFAVAASAEADPGSAVRPPRATFVTSVEVAPRAGGWQISLIEADNALTFPVGTGSWTVC